MEKKLRNGEINVAVEEEPVIWKDRKRTFLGLPWSFTVYQLTPSRFILYRGFFNKKIDEIRLYRITDLHYSQTLGNRILGLGNIKLFSSDASLPVFTIARIKNSVKVKDVLSQAVEVARRENGVRTSEIVGGRGMGGPMPPMQDGLAESGASLGPEIFPDANHDGIDDRTQ